MKISIVFTGSGLSSSAAFVCSSTIAIMAAFGVNFPKVCHGFKFVVWGVSLSSMYHMNGGNVGFC